MNDFPKINTAMVREELRLAVDIGLITQDVANTLVSGMMLDNIEEKHNTTPTDKKALAELADLMEHYKLYIGIGTPESPLLTTCHFYGGKGIYEFIDCATISADTIRIVRKKLK